MRGLPVGWINTIIGDITSYVQRGKGPKYTDENKFPVVNQKAIRWHGIKEQHLKYVHVEQWEKWAEERFIKVGDVLWNSTGTGTIGRACLVNEKEVIKAKVVDSHVTIVRASKLIESRYLFYWIMSPEIQFDIESLYTGTTNQVELSKGKILETSIPLPPLNEQIRIANKLDSLLAKVEAAQTHLDKIPTLLKRFRQSVLAAATSGELTAEWRGEHEINFVKIALGEAGVIIKTGPFGSALHKEDYVENGIPVINPMHINNGEITPSTSMSISQEKFLKLRAWELKTGDVIVGRRGQMGRAAEIKPNKKTLLCGTGSMILRTGESKMLPSYLCLILRSPISITYFESNSVGSTMVNLNQKIIKNLAAHYPPIEEQKQIVRRVESLFTLADTVEKQYQQARKRTDKLTQSLLAKAFRGELVPQDPNDEPAEKLLARIQAEREKLESVKKKRKK